MTESDDAIDPHDLDAGDVSAADADERTVDPDADAESVPVPLDADVEIPIADAIDQHRGVPLDDERAGGDD